MKITTRGRPYLDRLIFRIGLDSVASWLPGLEAGEIQVGNMVNGAGSQPGRRGRNLTVVGVATWRHGYLAQPRQLPRQARSCRR
ncbi:MAG: hypothetical protein R2873_23485 [Caldilineaceae bacterium]